MDLTQRIKAGRAELKADLVIKGGKLVNVVSEEIYPADIAIYGDRIVATGKVDNYIGPKTEIIDAGGKYLCPGLIDGHLHVECSKLSITSFAKAVVPIGTTSIISGLDQILVVAGLQGAREFLDEAKAGPLKVFWGAPCKTPYTLPRSNVGHYFGPEEHRIAHTWPECIGIWETVREFVQELDPDALQALAIAEENRMPVFGCSPMARGTKLNSYLAAGVRLDHESYTADEMLEKLRNGMFVVIRESSISHFLQENLRLVTEMGISATRRISFCTDDVVAADILKRGHLDNMVRMAIAMGISPLTAIQMATINSAEAYRIDHLVGCIAPGRIADILIVDDLRQFRIERVVTNGKLVAANGKLTAPLNPPSRGAHLTKTFNVDPIEPSEIAVKGRGSGAQQPVLAMAVTPEQIFVRKRRDVTLPMQAGLVQADVSQDVQYITVVERYGRTRNRPTAFVSGFGLKSGALATSTAPDDNNIVCVGANAEDMAVAINHLIANNGGQVVVDKGKVVAFLPLPIGGLVADIEPAEMARIEEELDDAARALGCTLPWPFMYMFVLQITAIPDYAITDLGPIDCLALKVFDPVEAAF
ncbi:adenine deaminase [Dongia soli]|uniref:Adenine deaminase n=1 Tax=Dongia soli TaxID=600628 RepID=A0ABU5E581_9PROT|nr:adenine deaminase [Dongia soli]MDY0881477.1 adenine deaminase [Dongia soli]